MNNMAPILTSVGKPYAQSPEVQQILCYYEDGKLLVSKSHANDPRALSFKAYLTRKKEPINIKFVDMQQIADAYAAESKGDITNKKESATKMEKMAKDLFHRAVAMHASDIHIRVSQRRRTKILFRVHNDLTLIEEHSSEIGEQLSTAIYQTMCDVSDTTFKILGRQDARISDRAKIPEKLDGIRIATAPQVDGHIMVMRLLYNDTSSGDIKPLGYSDAHVAAFTFMKRRPTGINIIGGPTGSGKSTTATRILTGYIQETHGRKHVITVEDPPEYPIENAVQTPVTDAESEAERSLEFQRAISSAMRLDPDVIFIGEIRDTASATLALRAAMTGHQVWSTLHTNNALAILDRLRDLGVPLALLCDPTIITGLACQRLVKTLCPSCKVSFKDSIRKYREEDAERVLMSLKDVAQVSVTGPGCSKCNNTGTAGRTVLAECIIPDERLMQFIQKEDRMGARKYWRDVLQGKSMIDHAITKVESGIIDPFTAEDTIGPLIMDAIESDFTIHHDEILSITK